MAEATGGARSSSRAASQRAAALGRRTRTRRALQVRLNAERAARLIRAVAELDAAAMGRSAEVERRSILRAVESLRRDLTAEIHELGRAVANLGLHLRTLTGTDVPTLADGVGAADADPACVVLTIRDVPSLAWALDFQLRLQKTPGLGQIEALKFSADVLVVRVWPAPGRTAADTVRALPGEGLRLLSREGRSLELSANAP